MRWCRLMTRTSRLVPCTSTDLQCEQIARSPCVIVGRARARITDSATDAIVGLLVRSDGLALRGKRRTKSRECGEGKTQLNAPVWLAAYG